MDRCRVKVGRRNLAIAHPAGLDCRKVGNQDTRVPSCTGRGVFGLRLRVHRFPQRGALHFEGDSAPRSHRDDVVIRFLDRSNHLQFADKRRGYYHAYTYCLSLRRG
jgi:hypothetical protein